MAFKDKHSPSILMKFLLSAGIFMGTLIPLLLMTDYGDFLVQSFNLTKIGGDFYRQLTIVSLSLIYFIRFAISMFVFLKRKIGWVEGCLVSILWFAMFYLFNSSAGNHSGPIGLIDIIGILIYLIGSHINTRSEYQRYIWKKRPENKGRLYTQGLFRHSMHINYFGDSLLYIGLAIITWDYICYFVSLVLILNFIFLQIPMQDKHLSNKYTDEFNEYAKRTKRLIPFIY